jgi:phosphoribosylformylglycinamidine cyclo-ligase
MNRTFNNGIGMVVVIAADQADACAASLRAAGEQVFVIGVIATRGDPSAAVVVR